MAQSDRPATPMPRPPERSDASRLLRLRVGAALVLERIGSALLALIGLAALFAALSWFGVFALLPAWGRFALLALLAVGVLGALWLARGLRLPRRAEIETRIERESRLAHQPLQAQSDRPSGDDPFALALWREHQARMSERLRALRGGAFRLGSERADPFALRALLVMLLATSFAYSFGPNGGRLTDAFASAPGVIPAGTRLDAWATPPGYTGRAPIFLTGTQGAPVPEGTIEVPQGTVVSVRLSDASGTAVRFQPETGEAAEIAPVAPDGATGEAPGTGAAAVSSGAFEFALPASGAITVETALRSLGTFRFAVLPDGPPQIRLDGEPQVARNGAMQIPFLVRDDYGAAGGEGLLALREETQPGARPLVAPPEIALSMPRRTKGEAKGRTTIDVTDSPYAGAKVALTLRVRDDAGQIGEAAPLELTLPARRFADPLARAVVEQRRILALDGTQVPRVVEMLDAVTLRGDEFIRNPADYLALRAARERIAHAADDDGLRSGVDFLWQIAVGIEDGDMGDAQRRLRDAQEKLSEALENGATDQEIAALMQELREAMREVMQAMAEAMRNMPPQDQAEMGEMQEIRPQDLDRMMDQIEDLARSGSREAAQQLLSELQNMMNNLQAMQRGQQGQQQGAQQSPMQQQMNQLGEMLQRQQQLMDQTFELGRQQMQRDMQSDRGQDPSEGQEGQQGGQQQPMTAEEMQRRMEELQQQQGQLQKDLQELQQAMREQGMEPSEDFGQAGEAMGEAQGQIGEGNSEGAVGEQGRAMEALRRGAQDAMQQMQAMGEGQGEGQQPGQGRQPGGNQFGEGYGPGQQRSGRDPLGRERQTQGPDFGQDVGVPDEIDIQRARRILDQIRDRLGHQLSPQQERDYLERLLQTP